MGFATRCHACCAGIPPFPSKVFGTSKGGTVNRAPEKIHFTQLKHGFSHQNKGKPPFTSCNAQVDPLSGSLFTGNPVTPVPRGRLCVCGSTIWRVGFTGVSTQSLAAPSRRNSTATCSNQGRQSWASSRFFGATPRLVRTNSIRPYSLLLPGQKPCSHVYKVVVGNVLHLNHFCANCGLVVELQPLICSNLTNFATPTSLPEFMNFKLFGRTILVGNIKFGLFLGHPLGK